MAAYLSGPQAGIYTASKFAVRGLTECLRYNLAPYGIGVSLMCPGPDPDQRLGFSPAAPGRLMRTPASHRWTRPSSSASAPPSKPAWTRSRSAQKTLRRHASRTAR